MHEISLVGNIFEALEEAYPGRITQIQNIELSIGMLSNVQPILMQNAYDAVIQDKPQYQHIQLTMKMLPVLIKCEACGQVTEIRNSIFICNCGEPGRNMIQGDELIISQVAFVAEP